MTVALPTGSDLARFLGRPNDVQFVGLCNEHVELVADLVRGYTRGVGFAGADGVASDLAGVVLMAAARLVTNPAQLSKEGADGWFAEGGFHGWSLAELSILNGYRRRTA